MSRTEPPASVPPMPSLPPGPGNALHVTEYAIRMPSGTMQVRDPATERAYPLADWIPHRREYGGKVYRRRVIVVEDWTEVGDDGEPLT